MNKKLLFWLPRILIILFALFLAIFSFDVFDSASGLKEILLGLFMHNLPSLTLIILLIISWKHDLIGGIIFMILAALCLVGTFINLFVGWPNPIFIIGTVIFSSIGVLFLIKKS